MKYTKDKIAQNSEALHNEDFLISRRLIWKQSAYRRRGGMGLEKEVGVRQEDKGVASLRAANITERKAEDSHALSSDGTQNVVERHPMGIYAMRTKHPEEGRMLERNQTLGWSKPHENHCYEVDINMGES